MSDITREELLIIIESMLDAQIRTIRSLRKTPSIPKQRRSSKGRSNIGVVIDVLSDADGPLHINEIVQRAHSMFGRKLSRESLVSSLTKKVLDHQVFKRVAPNTFDLIQRQEE